MTSAIIVIKGIDGGTVTFTVRHDGYPVGGLGDLLRNLLASERPGIDQSHNEVSAQISRRLGEGGYYPERWDGQLCYDWRYVLAYNSTVDAWTFRSIDRGPERPVLGDPYYEDSKERWARDIIYWLHHYLDASYDQLAQTPERSRPKEELDREAQELFQNLSLPGVSVAEEIFGHWAVLENAASVKDIEQKTDPSIQARLDQIDAEKEDLDREQILRSHKFDRLASEREQRNQALEAQFGFGIREGEDGRLYLYKDGKEVRRAMAEEITAWTYVRNISDLSKDGEHPNLLPLGSIDSDSIIKFRTEYSLIEGPDGLPHINYLLQQGMGRAATKEEIALWQEINSLVEVADLERSQGLGDGLDFDE